MDDTLLRFFIAATTFAVVVQAGILIGLYLAVRKSSAKMEALATEVRSKALPRWKLYRACCSNCAPKST